MKSLRLMLAVVLIALSTGAFAQPDAQKSFDQLKTLAGSWEGLVAGTGTPIDGKVIQATLRVTSMGNALMHEIRIEGRMDDPITMLYLDGGRLLLTHYCDAGNRPRMVAKVSPDGKTVEFGFLDVVGSTRYGNMHDAVFTVVDVNHHTEVWTWMDPEGQPVLARFDLQRKN